MSKTLFIMGSILSFIVLLIIYIFQIVSLSFNNLLYLGTAVLFTATSVVISSYYRASQQQVSYFILICISKIIFVTIFIVLLYLYDFNYLNYYMISVCLSILISFTFLRFKFKSEKLLLDKRLKLGMLFCLPVLFANLIVMLLPLFERAYLIDRVDSVSLAQYIFNFELGAKVSALFLLFMKIIVWPHITDKKSQRERIKYYKVGKYLLPSLVVMAFMGMFLEPLYKYFIDFFKPEYSNYKYFYLAVLYSCVVVFNYYINLGFLLTSRTYLMTISCLMTLIIHVLCVVLITPKYGVSGVAVSLILSMFLSSIIVGCINYKRLSRFGDEH